MRSLAVSVGLVAPLALVLAASCRAEPRGQLMVAVTTDMTPGIDFDRFQIEITQGNGPKQKKTFDAIGKPDLLTFPVTFAVVEGGADVPVQIRVLTGLSTSADTDVGTPRTLHEATVRVPEDSRIALLRMHVDWLCVGDARARPDRSVASECPLGLTCLAGRCVDWTVDLSTLPPFDEREVFGGVVASAAGAEGECFDTVRCFAAGEMASVRLEDCSIAAPGGPLGVALVPAPGAGGICGAAACYVPLDEGARHGFVVRGDRVLLPPAVCDRLRDPPPGRPGLLGVAVTTACATKTTRTPPCGDGFTARGSAPTFFAGPPAGYPLDAGRADGD